MRPRIRFNYAPHGVWRTTFGLLLVLAIAVILTRTVSMPGSYIGEGDLILIAALPRLGDTGRW